MTYVSLRERATNLVDADVPVATIATQLGISERAVRVHLAERDETLLALRSKELVEETGATYRQINYWTTQGHLKPVSVEGDDVAQAKVGSGRRQLYPRSAVLLVQLVLELLAIGFSVEAAFEVARATTKAPDTGVVLGDWTIQRRIA